jgi:hypothetical protein
MKRANCHNNMVSDTCEIAFQVRLATYITIVLFVTISVEAFKALAAHTLKPTRYVNLRGVKEIPVGHPVLGVVGGVGVGVRVGVDLGVWVRVGVGVGVGVGDGGEGGGGGGEAFGVGGGGGGTPGDTGGEAHEPVTQAVCDWLHMVPAPQL